MSSSCQVAQIISKPSNPKENHKQLFENLVSLIPTIGCEPSNPESWSLCDGKQYSPKIVQEFQHFRILVGILLFIPFFFFFLKKRIDFNSLFFNQIPIFVVFNLIRKRSHSYQDIFLVLLGKVALCVYINIYSCQFCIPIRIQFQPLLGKVAL